MSELRNVNVDEPIVITATRTWLDRGVTGLDVSLTIQRESDDLYWTDSNWGSRTVLTMPEVSSSNEPGVYEYTGPSASGTEIYRSRAYITSGQYAFDSYERLVTTVSNNDLAGQMTLNNSIISSVSGNMGLVTGFTPTALDSIFNKTIDNVSVSGILELMLAYSNGSFLYDESTKIVTFFKRDGETPITTMKFPDDNTRTRMS
jgi:hypothetical protein